MANQIKCSHCNSKKLSVTDNKKVFQCNACGSLTDMTDWKDYVVKGVGTMAGAGLAILTVGLLPDEVTDGVSGFFDDLLS